MVDGQIWWGDESIQSTVFAMKKCQHCCERPAVKTQCEAAPVCAPVHVERSYETTAWRTWLSYAAYAVLGLGGSLGAYSCFTKFRSRRRVGDEDKDNWQEDESDDARNRDISENLNCFVQYMMIITCLLITCLYVASLYIWKHRKDESEISTYCKRTISVSIVTFISHFISGGVFEQRDISMNIYDFLYGAILTVILFLGEICTSTASDWKRRLSLSKTLMIRNILIAPVLEELVFRLHFSLLLADYGKLATFFISSVLFWAAHFHHLVKSGKFGLAGIFSLVYTLAFSGVAFALLFKRGSVLAPIASHMVCNFLGVPHLGRAKLAHAASIVIFSSLLLVT